MWRAGHSDRTEPGAADDGGAGELVIGPVRKVSFSPQRTPRAQGEYLLIALSAFSAVDALLAFPAEKPRKPRIGQRIRPTSPLSYAVHPCDCAESLHVCQDPSPVDDRLAGVARPGHGPRSGTGQAETRSQDERDPDAELLSLPRT